MWWPGTRRCCIVVPLLALNVTYALVLAGVAIQPLNYCCPASSKVFASLTLVCSRCVDSVLFLDTCPFGTGLCAGGEGAEAHGHVCHAAARHRAAADGLPGAASHQVEHRQNGCFCTDVFAVAALQLVCSVAGCVCFFSWASCLLVLKLTEPGPRWTGNRGLELALFWPCLALPDSGSETALKTNCSLALRKVPMRRSRR